LDGDVNVDFDALEEALGHLGAGIEAPECHGVLVGWLLSSPWSPQGFPQGLTARAWVLGLLDGSTALDEGRESPRQAWALDVLEQTWGHTVGSLSSLECTFAPALPGDHRPIGRRARALGSWCAGFLSGLGQGGELAGIELSPQTAEVIGDLTEITRIEPSPHDDEASEAALAELVEYVRAAVMLVGEELGQLRRIEERELHRVH
jgi:uncharacterized protein